MTTVEEKGAELKEKATESKDKGNAAFKLNNFNEAIDLYTQAIMVYAKEPIFFTNRAQVRQAITSLLTRASETNGSFSRAGLHKS